jgi:putative SOS response-associated peptidase YedK
MCGRYDNLIAAEAYRRLFGTKRLPQSNFPPRYNVAPTDHIPIVRLGRDGEREIVLARWGLVPFWMKEMPKAPHINARAETVKSKPMFREAFAKRRCLIPATGFFEWQKRPDGKQPYRITRKDLEPFAFAGMWEFARIGGEEIVSACIIVCDANDLVAPLHDRMPVILEPADYDAWLDPATPVDKAKALLKPCSAEQLSAYPVSRIVGSPKNDVPECIKAIADPLSDRRGGRSGGQVR